MTPTEVLNEIEKMPLPDKRVLLEKLDREIREEDGKRSKGKEYSFIESLREKGMLSELPDQIPDDDLRQNFARISIKGQPLSATIIEERD